MKKLIALSILILLVLFAMTGVTNETPVPEQRFYSITPTPTPNFYTVNGEIIPNASMAVSHIQYFSDADLMAIPASAYAVNQLLKRVVELEKQVAEMKEKLPK
jgi:hypothetical protein